MRVLVLAVLATACATPAAHPVVASTAATAHVGPVKLVTKRFQAVGLDAATVSIVEAAFCNAMTEAGVRTACSEEIEILGQDLRSAPALGRCDSDKGPFGGELDEVANVTELATGVVSAKDGGFVIEVSIVDKATAKVRRRDSERSATAPDLLDAVGPLAARLAAP